MVKEMKLIAEQFRVLNYRNIDDSEWISLERVTAFVGRNEAGKTALLKALHKFNPSIPVGSNVEAWSERRMRANRTSGSTSVTGNEAEGSSS